MAQPFFLPSFTEFSWSLSRLLRTHQRWDTFYGSFRSLKPIFTGFFLLVFFYRFFCAKIDFFFQREIKTVTPAVLSLQLVVFRVLLSSSSFFF